MSEKWTTANIPDLTGKVIIITGANSGIGFEAAKEFARKGAQTILACRDAKKAEAAAKQIHTEYPDATLEIMALDLSDLSSVRAFAADFTSRYSSLDILCNNAGVMALPKRFETVDGFEMQFGTNHLGHFALTGLLLDVLLKTPNARVVTVSSGAHRFGKVEFDNLNAERVYKKWNAYGLSKLANLLFTYELQRRLARAGKDVIAVAAHPGYTATNLQTHSGLFSFLNNFLAQKQEMGALPTIRAAVDPQVKGGDYYGPGGFMEQRGYPVLVQSNDASHNMADAQKLWQVSEQLTGVHFGALD